MTSTFQYPYPSQRSLARNLFAPVGDWKTYLRAVHLFAMFPLGIAYFVALVVTFSVGGSLIWTFPGAAVILAAILASRFVGDLESKMVTAVSGVEIRRPPWNLEGIEGWRAKLWARMIDPTTWTGILYLLVQFPVGIAVFVVLVTVGAVAGASVGAPLIVIFTDEPLKFLTSDWFDITLDSAAEALWLVPVGLAVFFLLVHFVLLASALHAAWARFMLGSRARPQTVVDEQRRPPDPQGTRSPGEAGGPVGELPRTAPQPTSTATSADVRPFSPAPSPVPGVSGSVPLTPARTAALERFDLLTRREREIVQLITRGLNNAEIAEVCVISQGTVKTHVRRVLSKLDLRDRAQVVVFAYEAGVVAANPASSASSANRSEHSAMQTSQRNL